MGNTSKIKHRRRRRARAGDWRIAVKAAYPQFIGYTPVRCKGDTIYWLAEDGGATIAVTDRPDPGPVTLALGARLFGKHG